MSTYLTNSSRMQVVTNACTTAFDQAYMAWTRSEEDLREIWITVQDACNLELQDCVAADKAGVP